MNVERITDLESLKKLEDKWNELLFSSEQNCIFITHQWIYSWWKCFKEDNSLEILLLKDKSGVPFGIAPLMVKDGIFRFVGSQEVSDYCDFIIAYRRTEEFYKNLLNYFKSNNSVVKKIELMNIKSSSPTLTILPRLAGEYNFSCSFSEIEVAPVLDLQYSYENYLSRLSKKNRHELRRKLRRIESLKGIKTTKIKSTAELKTSIETFIAFHKKGTHSKVKFWERRGMSDFFREVVYRFSLKKWAERRA